MTQHLRSRGVLAIIVLAYSVLALLFAVRVPDWQTPDEPAHYNVIAQIAEDGRYPLIEMGDWDQAYLSALTASRFDPALLDDLDTVQYEDHQPAGYYLAMTPVYLLTDGSLTALRVVSAAFGLIIVVAAYGVGSLMFPARPWIGLGAAAFVAFLPQHVHILASVNNDSLAWAIVAVGLYLTVAYLKPERVPWVRPWHLALVVGLGLVTKATTYFLAGVVGLAILYRWWIETAETDRRAAFPALIRESALYLVPALALGLLWWGRNIIEYGFPDFLGLIAHDEVVVGQPRTADQIDALGFSTYLRDFLDTALNSFIGQFGWMGVPMNGWSYWLFIAVIGLGLAGAVLAVFWPVERKPGNRGPWMVLLLTILLALLAFIYYNLTFLQPQGRYTYPLLIPLGILIALGAETWLRLLLRVVPIAEDRAQLAYWLVPVGLLALAPVTLWLLWRVVVPNLELAG